MNKEEFLKKIEKMKDECLNLKFEDNNYYSGNEVYTKASSDLIAWLGYLEDFIRRYYGENTVPYNNFYKIDLTKFNGYNRNAFYDTTNKILGLLKLCERIAPESFDIKDNKGLLNTIFDKFHDVVRQLRKRHESRKTIDVEDEFDVQDLLHAILKIHFDDIRPEEWTPSYAGSSSRMDFLLKNEKIVIEVKKTRSGLEDKNIGKQLIEDIAKYKVHPDCKTLICFIYDPDGRISNPNGIITDLNKNDADFQVEIIIKPK